MSQLARRCRECNAPETLAEPFIDGVCVVCVRKASPASRATLPEPRTKPAVEAAPKPPPKPAAPRSPLTGWQLIGFGALSNIIGPVLYLMGMETVKESEPGLFNLVLFGVVVLGILMTVWGVLAQLAGVIRWAVEPMIVSHQESLAVLRSMQSELQRRG